MPTVKFRHSMLKTDLEKLFRVDCSRDTSALQKIFTLLFGYGFHAICVYRFGRLIDRYFNKPHLFPVYFILQAIAAFLRASVNLFYGIYIDKNARIGCSFYIGHFGSIYIGPAIIGDNCSVHQSVTVKSAAGKAGSKRTILGNNIWIGAHSSISEGVRISDGVTVAAGTMVISDIEKSNALIMGNPGRIILKFYSNTHLMGTAP